MNDNFNYIKPDEINDNPFKLIGSDWMLITAGDTSSFNMMTASWGGFGVLWHKNVCFCFIRPTRYTFEFMEKSNSFTLNFFEEKYRKVLEFCGSNSGRDVDKTKATSLTPVLEKDIIYFKESKMVIACKKIYFQDINSKNFLSDDINKNYPKKDYHRMYVGEIIKVLRRI